MINSFTDMLSQVFGWLSDNQIIMMQRRTKS